MGIITSKTLLLSTTIICSIDTEVQNVQLHHLCTAITFIFILLWNKFLSSLTFEFIQQTPRYIQTINTLRPRKNGRHFAGIFKCAFLNENVWISIKIPQNFVPKGPVNNTVPLSEPMMVSLLIHMCVTQLQWVNPYHKDTVSMPCDG